MGCFENYSKKNLVEIILKLTPDNLNERMLVAHFWKEQKKKP